MITLLSDQRATLTRDMSRGTLKCGLNTMHPNAINIHKQQPFKLVMVDTSRLQYVAGIIHN